MNMKRKLTSRKFWVSVASLLASIGTLIGGVYIDNESLAYAGLVCSVISAAIYTIAESAVDGANKDYSEESEG